MSGAWYKQFVDKYNKYSTPDEDNFMTNDNQTPEPTLRPLDIINGRHALITQVDVSNSVVDPMLYMKREMLLYESYKTSDDEDKVIDFFHASYGFRIAFSSVKEDRGSFALFPQGGCFMMSSPIEDLSVEHDVDKVTAIYSVLFNVTLDEWKETLETDAYKAFKVAKDNVGPVLGWDISDYRSVELPATLTRADQVTYEIAADLWKKAKAV